LYITDSTQMPLAILYSMIVPVFRCFIINVRWSVAPLTLGVSYFLMQFQTY
jgi:hypothetical protein